MKPKKALLAEPPDDVRRLQAMAEAALSSLAQDQHQQRFSRAAELHLIDNLSRWGGPAHALIAGAALFVATVGGRAAPFETAVWMGLVLSALFVSRKLHRGFRRGERIAGRPFRWRARYTASLAALSAAVGAGQWFVGAGFSEAIDLAALLAAGLLSASLLHAIHPPGALCAAAPGMTLVAAGLFRTDGPTLSFFGLVIATIAIGLSISLVGAAARRQCKARFPRTRMLPGHVRRRQRDRADNPTSKDQCEPMTVSPSSAIAGSRGL